MVQLEMMSYVGELPDRTGMVLAAQTHTGATIPNVTTVATATTVTNAVTVGTNNDKTGYDLSAGARTSLATSVWASGGRTLTGFGTLVADIWGNATRTLSAFTFTVGATLSASERTAVADAILDLEIFSGVTYRDVMLGRVNYTRTKLTNTTGTWSYTRNGHVLASGTYVDEASGKTLTLTSGS